MEARAALDRLATLPPEIGVPALVALRHLAMEVADVWDSVDVWDAAKVLAHAMRDVGDTFLSIVDALADGNLRAALLPLPDDSSLRDALRALTRDDPPTAQRLAFALHGRFWRDALLALLVAPLHHARAVWHALDAEVRRAISTAIPVTAPDAAMSADLASIDALMLKALSTDDAALRNDVFAALTKRPETIRVMWESLPPEARHALRAHPAVAVAIADRDVPSPAAGGHGGARRSRFPR